MQIEIIILWSSLNLTELIKSDNTLVFVTIPKFRFVRKKNVWKKTLFSNNSYLWNPKSYLVEAELIF